MTYPGGSDSKSLSTMWETQVRSLGREDPLEKEMEIHSSTTAWKIPWTEEPGRLQSMGSVQESDMTEQLRFHFHCKNHSFWYTDLDRPSDVFGL